MPQGRGGILPPLASPPCRRPDSISAHIWPQRGVPVWGEGAGRVRRRPLGAGHAGRRGVLGSGAQDSACPAASARSQPHQTPALTGGRSSQCELGGWAAGAGT